MRRLLLATVLALSVFVLVLAGSAAAGGTHHHHGPPPVVVDPAPEPAPHVDPPPPAAVSYCVATDRGWTYVQATAGAFDLGAPWRLLYDRRATVTVAGNLVTFAGIGDIGIRPASIVPGIGSTCP